MVWASIPVDPDADTAREWAINELAKSEYTRAGSNWLEAFWQWLMDLFEGVGRVGGNIGSLGVPGMLLFVVLGIALVAVVVWIVVGPLRRSRRSRSDAEVFGGDERDSSALASAADEAAAAGDWTTALVHLYRAMVRHLDERGSIDIYAGMTAHEAAVLASRALPRVADGIATDADAFDDARYGRRATTEDDFRHAVSTFAAIRSAAKRRVVST
ncbi:DUF4129 domain-containing protein [Demequina oxidasica]|uniref:DUF4129 domain-containing protein n=1 Tax=Demequina oxidasica TaxID=676199 RepID=UPI000780A4A9|nr:DUF4129 domain-containing protein [Demequina oxidasica]